MPKDETNPKLIPLFKNIGELIAEFDDVFGSPTVEERYMTPAEIEEMTKEGSFTPITADRPYIAGVLKHVEEMIVASPGERIQVRIDLYRKT